MTLDDIFRLIQQYVDAEVPLVVLDSLGGAFTSEQIEAFNQEKEARLGSVSRIVGTGLGALLAGGKDHVPFHQSKTSLIILNHIYDKMEDTSKKPVYDRYIALAGHKLKYLAHLRMFFWTVKHEKGENESMKQLIRMWITKTRFSAPFRHADIYIDFDNAAYEDNDLIIRLGLLSGVVEPGGGSWYSIAGERFNGKDAACKKLLADQDLIARVFGTDTEGKEVKSVNAFE
jgi:hypothetical protein